MLYCYMGKTYHKKSKDFLKISDKDWKGRTFSAVAAVIVSANSIPEDRRGRRHQLQSTSNNNETAQELVKHTNKGSRTQEEISLLKQSLSILYSLYNF